ncbi:hypothetical protein ACWOFH_02340 [Aerococcus christensenii]|uniref:hypothetical protein n=1 Tax=Aerococcus christensenii TaxID=87541 RepID=UPI0023A96F10|nr:hypothetical protein [Aerococcus christensenii]WEB71538.1 hypothetical protein PUW42_03020 [Aerococcus christensenii]
MTLTQDLKKYNELSLKIISLLFEKHPDPHVLLEIQSNFQCPFLARHLNACQLKEKLAKGETIPSDQVKRLLLFALQLCQQKVKLLLDPKTANLACPLK